MSSIFKKLSVILCCLFGLISINPVTWAKPGDYLVYFFGKDYNPAYFPECGKCKKFLNNRAGQFCCSKHCYLCANDNMPGSAGCQCGLNSAYHFLQKYGPFCFINYENGGDFDTVFESAEKSGELYCAYCIKEKLKGNFDGKIFVNIPETYEVQFGEIFNLNAGNASNICNNCESWLINSVKPIFPLLSLLNK